MKKAILSMMLFMVIGCNNNTDPNAPPQPKYPPPDEIGDGKVFLFQANSDEDFHNRLNEFFSWHKDYRMSNIRDMSNNKWIVIVETINGVKSPTTVPADFGNPNAQGEIKY